ncbi:MAG: SRPBCC domain-containing protein [Bacteroidales bacterium]|nr:SRPBCC domain-containing protein [Bacteroidales bacterium]
MKKRILLEYTINASPKVLFPRLSTPGGLAEWFADDVYVKGKIFSFIWDGVENIAEVVQKKENRYIRFHWVEETDPNTYFEFRITMDELTNDVALVITDFAEEDEKADTIELWNTQIAELKHVLGL